MHLLYGSTTITLDVEVIAQKESSPDDNSEKHLSITRKTVAIYSNGPMRVQKILFCNMTISKMNDLLTLYQSVGNGAAVLTYRDKAGTDHEVKWVDDKFLINHTGFNTAEGTITLEVT